MIHWEVEFIGLCVLFQQPSLNIFDFLALFFHVLSLSMTETKRAEKKNSSIFGWGLVFSKNFVVNMPPNALELQISL